MAKEKVFEDEKEFTIIADSKYFKKGDKVMLTHELFSIFKKKKLV